MPRSARLPIALVAAVVVAEAAVLLLRPRDTGPEPVDVEPRAYFTSAQIKKGEDYRSGQLALYGVRVVVELGVLVLIVVRPPRVLRRDFRRPVLAGAAAGASLSLALGLVTLPVRAIARERSKDVGLVTQSWVGYAGDVAKNEAISVALAGAGAALLVVGVRRFGRRWWVPATAVVVGFGVIVTYAGPVLLDPLFNDFKRLPDGRARSDVLELAERAGVRVGQVYEVDASRRTTAANAYVTGLGKTKRVVLYDNLLREFDPAEVRLVVAHELGHVKHDDVPRGLLYLALVAPVGMFAVARLTERLAKGAQPGPALVPAAALALALAAPAITIVSNQLSRAVERRADAYSIELTREPGTLIAMQRRLAVSNVSDPDPPRWTRLLLGTHPTTIERIGAAEAIRRQEREQAAAP